MRKHLPIALAGAALLVSATGAFILIDEGTNDTVGAGMVA